MTDAIAGAGVRATLAGTAFAAAIACVRLEGADLLRALAICALLAAALAVAWRQPVLLTQPLAATAAGVTLAAGAFAAGQDSPLLFLPLALALCTLAAVAPLRVPIAASIVIACAFAVHLADAPGDRHLLLIANAVGLIALPLAMATLTRRQAAEPEPDPEPPPSADPLPGLTPRQSQAVRLVSEGHRHAEVADSLGVSVQQVRRLLRDARERTGASTTRELVAAVAMETRDPT